MVFPPERDGPDGPLDRVIVEFDAAVIKESGEGWPARERITNGLGEGAGRWNAAKLHLEPGLHRAYQRQRFCLPRALPIGGRLTTDGGLDGIELSDAPQRFSRDGRIGRLMHLIKLASCVGPARCQYDVAWHGQPFEANIA